jgi:hypothetical protein
MLTHQSERPEKCPITTCKYHLKGFARRGDKNRHTLTHYKGTMVCSFCPGFRSAVKKPFNCVNALKEHLRWVHGVKHKPNSRKTKKAQNLGGNCSICSVSFANAQGFYEHLDNCVLRVMQQVNRFAVIPIEAVNFYPLRKTVVVDIQS